ncbi:MAG: histidine kinase [Candidatus Dormibacteria bacterium]
MTQGVRSARQAVGFAGLVLLVAILLLSAAIVTLIVLDGPAGSSEAPRALAAVVSGTALGVVGALLLRHVTHNPIGWFFSSAGVGLTLTEAGAMFGLHVSSVGYTSTAGRLGFSIYWTAYVSLGLLLTFVILLFPNGRLVSRRWRPVALFIGLALGGCLAAIAVSSFPTAPHLHVDRWTGVPASETRGGELTEILSGRFFPLLFLSAGISVGSMVSRARRSDGLHRQQIKWFAVAGTLVVFAGFAPHIFFTEIAGGSYGPLSVTITNATFFLSLSAIPLATGFAILRYRLYDIDIVISRTLVYGALAAFITAVYVFIVVGIGGLVGSGGKPNPVLSIIATAVVAVAFQPVRERLQRVANRLVYGKRATPYEVLSVFSQRVAGSLGADDLLVRMARVLGEGTGAQQATVWVRGGAGLRPSAGWPQPPGEGPGPVLPMVGQDLPPLPEADVAVPVRHQGDLLGALSIRKRQGESLTPIEEKLLGDLAQQAGLVLRNVGLTADLQARLVDLRGSRQRLVAAQDQERRRLERNLHDGAQQNLVALKVKLGLAETVAGKGPERTSLLVGELKKDADEALETLRDLARGIYPPLLADQGLVAALSAQARKAVVPVEVIATDVGRYPQDIESAVYFSCLEALQNIQKYARAGSATITLTGTAESLLFEVADDGVGFDSAVVARGSGLQNIEDRLDAIGGSLAVDSRPGGGTRVGGQLPVAPALATISEGIATGVGIAVTA